MPLGKLAAYAKPLAPGLDFGSDQFPTNVDPGRQQVMAPTGGCLPPMGEIQTTFQAPGFDPLT